MYTRHVVYYASVELYNAMAELGTSSNASSEGPACSVGHQTRGVGYSSRFRVTEDALPPGWRQERKGAKYTVWFDEKGNRYKSSSEVERAIRARGLVGVSEEETETETGGETSEFEPSPVKKSRSDV